MDDAVLRRAGPEDVDFLSAMFIEALSWRAGNPRRARVEILDYPELATYLVDWGRPGDAALIAESSTGERIGAAWYRHFTPADHGYGFVAEEVPELGIAVLPEHRRRGVGRTLMFGLIRLAEEAGCPALSLSVEEDNRPAVRLYEGLDFQRIRHAGGAWTMLLDLETTSVEPA
ncbi:MAG: N-acetyltransferase family protein [Candidatus Dormibacteria bacterium]